MKKNEILELLRVMPEDIDADDLIYRLYLKQKLEIAEAAAQADDVIPHEEVVKRSREWLK